MWHSPNTAAYANAVLQTRIVAMRTAVLIYCLFAAGLAGCFGDPQPADPTDLIDQGVVALEADQYALAISSFTSAVTVAPQDCRPQVGLALAHLLETVAQYRSFNSLLFGSLAADPDSLDVQADGGLIEKSLVQPLLLPWQASLTSLAAAATAGGDEPCRLTARLPFKVGISDFISVNLRLGPDWTEREMQVLRFLSSFVLSVNQLLLSHDLEIPPLTALKVTNRLDRSDLVSFLRVLGVVPAEAPRFLEWHQDPERKDYFARITTTAGNAFLALEALGRQGLGFLEQLPESTGTELFYLLDVDGDGTMNPGDRLVMNMEGKIQIGRDVPILVGPAEFRIHGTVQPEVLGDATGFLNLAARVFAGELTPGTQLRLESLNGIFMTFGQDRPFEDVLRLDPLAYFRGPLQATWQRRDLNDNCKTPVGSDVECECLDKRTIEDPETGEQTQISVQPDVLSISDTGPVDVCLREGLEPLDGRYPQPPKPKPLRDVLPYWYIDPFLNEGQPVLGVEGEKSPNVLPNTYLPPFVSLGDFDHFLFGEVRTDVGTIDIHIPNDCISAPSEDKFGLITVPYTAFRDPAFNNSTFVNLSVLTGGDCNDSQSIEYRSWNPADVYAMNKVVAHYASRYGRLIYDVFSFLIQ